MKRRDFIKKTGQAAALAAVTGGTGLLFHNRQVNATEKLVSKSANFEIAADKNFPKMVLAKNTDHTAALNAALDAVGGIKRFVSKGQKVTIKPNIGSDRTPEQAANTNPVLVGEMVKLCLAAGVSQVIVTDIPCNEARRTFLRSGIREAVEKAGGTIILPDEKDYIRMDVKGKFVGERWVLKHFIETDRLINMPIVKHHGMSLCTIGMKNFYGLLGDNRGQMHQQIDQSIVDLASFCRPTLVVVDATRVLLRNGPTGGSLSDVAIHDSVICATDQVAADSRGCEFLGLSADKVGFIPLAEKTGLGMADYKNAGYKEIAA
jgi:uncharacterized protein (DUF362 family)